MLRVEISRRAGQAPWVDHLGNPVEKLVFGKEYNEQYMPGHYALESFGSLYRSIDNFRESPTQRLTDWEIRIPQIYSSKDGSFSTVDLIYYLESVNEDGFLIGCEAVLLEDGNPIFVAVVDSVSSDSIAFGESIGSPEIPRSDFPISIGNASVSHWPIKIIKNKFNHYVMIISEKPLKEKPSFFIYLEKNGGYIPVDLEFPNQAVKFSLGFTEAIFVDPSFVRVLGSYAIFNIAEPILLGQLLLEFLRPDSQKNIPDYYLIGNDDIFERVQAWSNRFTNTHHTSLGRSTLEHQINIPGNSKLIRTSHLKTMVIEFSCYNYPESLVFEGEEANLYDLPYTSGNPDFFLETSRTGESIIDPITGHTNWEIYPNVFVKRRGPFPSGHSEFTIKFQKLDLPGSAYPVEIFLEHKIMRNRQILYSGGDFSAWGSLGTGTLEDTDCWQTVLFVAQSFKDVETIKMQVADESMNEGFAAFIGLRLKFKIRIPFEDAKLYAGGTITDYDYNNNQQLGNSLVPSINTLLYLANAADYSARPIGELNEIKYGHVISNEAASFREKLRSLAAESATLVKFSPTAKEFLVKSVSRQFKHRIVQIPLNAIVLENNLYHFKKESPYRNDVLSGISISWGKNAETGEYENIMLIDPLSAGSWDVRDGNLGAEKWDPVFRQLEKNARLNIGTVKNIDSEWIMDLDGAEIMAYNYLCWNCAPISKAQANCITAVLRELEEPVDIGSFVSFALPGYPPKFAQTAWVVTGIKDDLDGYISSLELLEAWNMPAPFPDRFLLLEDGGNILMETGEKIKLEDLHA